MALRAGSWLDFLSKGMRVCERMGVCVRERVRDRESERQRERERGRVLSFATARMQLAKFPVGKCVLSVFVWVVSWLYTQAVGCISC